MDSAHNTEDCVTGATIPKRIIDNIMLVSYFLSSSKFNIR